MNRKKRNRNRANARALQELAHVCPECGERGKHWVHWSIPTLADILNNTPPSGFWICPKFYDPETGRRIEEPTRDAEAERDLPEGVTERDGELFAKCQSCERWYELPCDPAEFNPDYSYCWGSDRCVP